MKIYIASSWKNQHAVEMLTAQLRARGHEVLSFIENNYGEGHAPDMPIPFEKWVETEQAEKAFEYDVKAATTSNLVIYISPSGTDAWAEVGAAWGAGVPVIGLWSKGEPAGLMRKMMGTWASRYQHILEYVDTVYSKAFNQTERTAL